MFQEFEQGSVNSLCLALIGLPSAPDSALIRAGLEGLRRLHSYIWFIMLLYVVFSFSTWYHSIYLPILSLFLFTVSWAAFPKQKWKAWWVKISFKGRELASPLKRRDSNTWRELASPLKRKDSNTWRGMQEIIRVLFWRLL